MSKIGSLLVIIITLMAFQAGQVEIMSQSMVVPTIVPTITPQSIVALPIVPAFPGAEGFGARSLGGRGGQVIEVTNLNDSGPGSLRAAIQAQGPRIVVFRVGGTIELDSMLRINNPYITIAGQTAPGGGIALKNRDNNRSSIWIETHDVVIRHIRVRPGPHPNASSDLRAISLSGASNVIIDHVSMSWASDETISTWLDSHDITIQWSIISEPLNARGMLLGSAGSSNISVHHNLFAHNNDRTPRMNMGGVADVVNNVIYNTRDHPSTINNEYHPRPPVNYVANYVKKGPESIRDFLVDTKGIPAEIYVQDNITAGRPTDDLDEVEGVVREDSMEFVIATRHVAAPVTTSSAADAYNQVLANVGATLPVRDIVDERILNNVINGTGKIINDPSEVGGWPEIAAGTPPLDSDHDGMADSWEILYGFNPDNPSDGSLDADGDGYTNIEEYLNAIGARVARPNVMQHRF